MTFEVLIQIFLLGIALAMDAFAVSVTDGLTYTDINKKKSFFIAGVFGLMQGLMPLVGYWIIELVRFIADEASGNKSGEVMGWIVVILAFVLLLFIGGKMLFEGIRDLRNKDEEKEPKKFSFREVILFGFATSIDAMATGVTLNAGLSNHGTIWLHVGIIAVITFGICLIGLFLGKMILRLFKGKYEVCVVIGGVILILLAAWVLISHLLNI